MDRWGRFHLVSVEMMTMLMMMMMIVMMMMMMVAMCIPVLWLTSD